MRRRDPTLRDGEQMMIDESNPSVLSYVRKGVGGNPAIVVALNFTSEPQTVSLNPETAGVSGKKVSTLITDAPLLRETSSLHNITLPPYASWVGSIK
jgi:alpha-glucosidase